MTIFEDGKLSKSVRAVSAAVGLTSAVSISFFLDDLTNPFVWVLTVLAIVFGYGSAWSELSAKWGFKPITTDPLGWRHAKKTYASSETESSRQDETS